MKTGRIYLLICTSTGLCYVGRTVCSLERRFRDHAKYAERHPEANFKLACAFRAYGIEAFTISLLEEVDRELLSSREAHWIAELDTFNNGLNSTTGGESYQMSEAMCEKARLRMLGKSGTDHPSFGYRHDEATKERIAKARRGKQVSPDTREKMSVAHRGERNSNYGRVQSTEERERRAEAMRRYHASKRATHE